MLGALECSRQLVVLDVGDLRIRDVLDKARFQCMSSWRESIIDALSALGGEGVYEEIYAEVAARRTSLPPSWQAIIRRTIQQASSDSAAFVASNEDVFYSVSGLGNGRWGLRAGVIDTPGTQSNPVSREGIAENPGGQGYVVDSVVRRAIEQHAVKTAIDHYRSRGASKIVEVGKPYDLRMLIAGKEIHVEVKGSLQTLSTVIVTRNEIIHARRTPDTELIVIDQIELTTQLDGIVKTAGGRVRVWRPWAPAKESLKAMVFEHTLDATGRLA